MNWTGSVDLDARASLRPINQEPPHASNICHAFDVLRARRIHRRKLRHTKPTTTFSSPPQTYAFLDKNITKNYLFQERGEEITKNNLRLLSKLASIKQPKPKRRHKRNKFGMKKVPLNALKEEARKRDAERINRENLALLYRLQNRKPNYPLVKFREKRREEVKIMKLRRTDYTAGHLSPSHHLEQKARSKTRGRGTKRANFSRTSDHPQTAPAAVLAPLRAQSAPTDIVAAEQVTVPTLFKHAVDAEEDEDAEDIDDKITSLAERAIEDDFIHMAESKHSMLHHKPVATSTVIFTTSRKLATDTDTGNNSSGDTTPTIGITIEAVEPWAGVLNVRWVVQEDGLASGDELSTTVSVTKVRELLSQDSHARTSYEKWLLNKEAVNAEKELAYMHSYLIGLFQEADVSNRGTLTIDEFVALLQQANLCVSDKELLMIMSEADENDDGVIDYCEFVPTVLELVAAFQAKAKARAQASERQGELTINDFKAIYGAELKQATDIVMAEFAASDPRSVGQISRLEFKRCIRTHQAGLSRAEVNMIMAAIPQDVFGKIMYRKFERVMFDVRLTTVRNSIMETSASSLEKYLMNLCEEEELGTLPKNDDEDEEERRHRLEGNLDPRSLQQLITVAKRLKLSRLQVLAVMSEAEEVDGMVNYRVFIPIAAHTIEAMFDPKVLQQRAELMGRAEMAPGAVFSGMQKEELLEKLFSHFQIFDADNAGGLNPKQFCECLKSADLGLSEGEIWALMLSADSDGDGQIDFDEFKVLAYDELMHLAREKAIRELIELANDDKPPPEVVQARKLSNLRQHGIQALEDVTKKWAQEIPLDTDLTPDESEAAQIDQLEKTLCAIFSEMDKASKGFLSPAEFREALGMASLGVKAEELTVLMAEADENNDGVISYKEFVPLAMEMLQAFKSRDKARTEVEIKAKEISDKARADLFSAELGASIAVIEAEFAAADDSGSGLLERSVYRRCIMNGAASLSRNEINMIMGTVPQNEHGLVSFKNFSDIMYEVRLLQLKNAIVMESTSQLESYLMDLCREEEVHKWAKSNAPHRPTNRRQSIMRAPHTADTEQHSGLLTLRQIQHILVNANQLMLTHLQVLVIMSLAEGRRGVINYKKFVPLAALTIEGMFEPKQIEQRRELCLRAEIQPLELFHGQGREKVERALRASFMKSDTSGTGVLNEEEFGACIIALNLDLSEGDITALRLMADQNGDGMVDWNEFLTLAYDMLLRMKREKALREINLRQQRITKDMRDLIFVPCGDDDRAVSSMEETLVNLFHNADKDGSGVLDFNEFHTLLQDSNLGIGASELKLLMSEVDENNDGEIQYQEFVPLAVELLSVIKAKSQAVRELASEHHDDWNDDEAMRTMGRDELKRDVKRILAMLHKADHSGGHKMLSRAAFKRCLKKSSAGLRRHEVNMILSMMKPDGARGMVCYANFHDVLEEVRLLAATKSYIDSHASDAEKYLMERCEEEERANLAQGGHTTGFLSARQIKKVLMESSQLMLSRMQVLALLSEGKEGKDTSMIIGDTVNYRTFVPVAARAIQSMFDPEVIRRRAELIQRSTVQPVGLLSEAQREEVEERLRRLFKTYDADGSGTLDAEEFKACLQHSDVKLSDGYVMACLASADQDINGNVDYEEFMSLFYDLLLHLGREQMLKEQSVRTREEEAKRRKQEKEEARRLHQKRLTAVEKRLVKAFHDADKEGTGFLTPLQFKNALCGNNQSWLLGEDDEEGESQVGLVISSNEVELLLREADENDDGVIEYTEFLPLALEVMDAYHAKNIGKNIVEKRSEWADHEALRELHEHEFISLNRQIAILSKCLDEVELPPKGSKRVSRSHLRRCVRLPRVGFNRQRSNMVIAKTPEIDGSADYSKIGDIVREVRLTELKSSLIERDASAIEKNLLQLCRAAERKQLGVSVDDDFSYSGLLPLSTFKNILTNAPSLMLTKTQVVVVVAGATGRRGLFSYVDYVPLAATSIKAMFCPEHLQRRKSLMLRSEVQPVELLSGKKWGEVEIQIKKMFQDFDKDRHGFLNADEFEKCLKAANLGLDKDAIHALMMDADVDGDGVIEYNEFLLCAHDSIVSLIREKVLLQLRGNTEMDDDASVGSIDSHVAASTVKGERLKAKLEPLAESLAKLVDVETDDTGAEKLTFRVFDAAAKMEKEPLVRALSMRTSNRGSVIRMDEHSSASARVNLLKRAQGRETVATANRGPSDLLFGIERECPLVDAKGGAERGLVPMKLEVFFVEVPANESVKDVVVVGSDQAVKSEPLRLVVRMPSLVCADWGATKTFARRLCDRVRVVARGDSRGLAVR